MALFLTFFSLAPSPDQLGLFVPPPVGCQLGLQSNASKEARKDQTARLPAGGGVRTLVRGDDGDDNAYGGKGPTPLLRNRITS